MSHYGSVRRQQPARQNSGSTALELGLPPDHDQEDQESIQTAIVMASDPSQPLYDYTKEMASPIDTPRGAARTPSPTPSEIKELSTGAIDWRAMRSWRFWFRREWLWYYVALVIIVVITALVSIYHRQIVDWLTPAANWLHDTPAGWLVPIGVLFVISFPPLFGHEIVSILCGLVWGFWVGFGIVAAGTLLGEIGNFYAFKYCCRTRGAKLERTNLSYACLAKVVRDGGFTIALIARLSAIPGHFTTAIFSTCGMGIIVFTLATTLSMPKQALGVYIGVILRDSAAGETDSRSSTVSNIVLAVTVVITIVAMWYILRQMNKVKPDVIYRRRKLRQAKLSRPEIPYPSSSPSPTDTFTPRSIGSDSTIAVTEDGPTKSQAEDIQLAFMSSTTRLPDFPPLEAPRPTRPISIEQQPALTSRRASIVDPEPQGPYSSRNRAREESAEEVGWDMGTGPVNSDNPYRRGAEHGTQPARGVYSLTSRPWI